MNDLDEMGLKTYLTLDLDADMMRKDLKEKCGIHINAHHFDLEKTQQEIDENVQEEQNRDQQHKSKV